MNLNYSIDNESFEVNIYMSGTHVPIINQPNWPNGEPWSDFNDANLWAQLCILSIINEEAPFAPAGPGLSGQPK